MHLFWFLYLSAVFCFSGETDDDHKELLAAANAALTTGVIWDHPNNLGDGSTNGNLLI